MSFACRFCGQTFTRPNNMYRHQKHRCPKRPTVVEKRHLDLKPNKPKTKIPINIKPRKSSPKKSTATQQVNIINNYNFTDNRQLVINISIGDTDIYEQLKTQLGSVEAMQFLANMAVKNRPIDVIQRTYLSSGDPHSYPFANDGQSFRYLQNGKVVEDSEGKLVDKLKDAVQKALIQATNDLIASNIDGGTVDLLYDVYDIGTIQNNIPQIDELNFSEQLNRRTYNPSHAFFQQPLAVNTFLEK